MATATTPEAWLRIVEVALLSAPGPLPVSELRKLFDEDPGPDLVRRLLDELRTQWFEAGRGSSWCSWRAAGSPDAARVPGPPDRLKEEKPPLLARGHGNAGDHRLSPARHTR